MAPRLDVHLGENAWKASRLCGLSLPTLFFQIVMYNSSDYRELTQNFAESNFGFDRMLALLDNRAESNAAMGQLADLKGTEQRKCQKRRATRHPTEKRLRSGKRLGCNLEVRLASL